jgi:hypothetical protein
MNGIINSPDIKKRTPAKLRGVVYCRPIFIAANGVAQSRHATIAKKLVEFKNLCTLFNLDFV